MSYSSFAEVYDKMQERKGIVGVSARLAAGRGNPGCKLRFVNFPCVLPPLW